MLAEMGLDDEQETVYRALLHAPQCGRAELADRTGQDAGGLAARLDALRSLGLVRDAPEAPSGAAAVDAIVAARGLLARAEDDVAAQQRRLVDLRVAMALQRGAREQPAGVEEVRGVEQVRERVAELSFFTRRSICVVQPARAPSAESVAAARPLDARSSRRGIAVRVVHDAALVAQPVALEHLHAVAATGAGIRLVPGPLQRMILLDNRVAVLPLDPDDSSRGATVVHGPGIVAALTAMFERTWTAGSELPGDLPDAGPDPADRAVLALLAQGCTDEVTARRTGMSGRNVRRRVARLMDELGAGSRFAAGAAAVRRGWI